MNVYGRTGTYDQMTVGAAAADANGTGIDYSGIEMLRIVTADVGDTVQLDAPAQLVSWWDPQRED
jgi:hypothetical protein